MTWSIVGAMILLRLRRILIDGDPETRSRLLLQIFTQTCVELTEGQHLDMSFESRLWVTVDEYMRMIWGKTAALLAASTAIGALLGGGLGEALGLEQIGADVVA